MINPGPAPKLVATDVDGTLINSAERVPQRLREVIARLTDQGVTLALSTGRPPRWIHNVLEQINVLPMCICANGAVLYDAAKDEVVAAHTLSSETMTNAVMVAREALAAHGGIGVAVERAGRSALDPTDELFVVTPEYSHAWPSAEHGLVSEEEVLSQPATKLLMRSEVLESQQLFDIVRAALPEDHVHVTFSMAGGLIEVAAPGVTKALGVSNLAQRLNIAREDVITFGDMPNDIEMLRWAGTGVAMGNALPIVKEAADYITNTNDEAGVAEILEWWF